MPSSKRSSLLPPPSRPPALASVGEEEMTSILSGPQSRSLASSLGPQSRSFTGPAPQSFSLTGPVPQQSLSMTGPILPPSRRPPPASVRPPVRHDDDAEDDEDGRTVVRDAPKIVRRANTKSMTGPSQMSPSAVIKATLDGPRSRRELLPGPPPALLEDRSDFDVSPRTERPFGQRTPMSDHAPSHPSGQTMGGARVDQTMRAEVSHRQEKVTAPAPISYRNDSYGMSGGPASSVPGVSSAPASMPAHFMTPAPPYSDPPGTSVTAGYRVTGRPAVSWAAALLACGLFVGVSAVAVMQTSEAAADTTASFVDPSRAPSRNAAAQPAAQAPAPVPVPVAPPFGQSPPVQAQPAVIGASNAPARAPDPAPPAPPATPPPGPSVGGFGSVVGGFAPVAVPPAPAAPKPAARPVWRAPAPAAPRPARPAAAIAGTQDDDAPKKEPKKKRAEADDETKKALEALQKAQLESASSFGKE